MIAAIPPPLNIIAEPFLLLMRLFGLNFDLRTASALDATAHKESLIQLKMLFRQLVDRHNNEQQKRQEQEQAADIADLRQHIFQLKSTLAVLAEKLLDE